MSVNASPIDLEMLALVFEAPRGVCCIHPKLLFLQYAQETQHEKILRGLAVGIAFTMYGRLEEAEPLISSLISDKDPILRRSGMFTLAMAYSGTGNNQAIRKLLHVAVSILSFTFLYSSCE
ncbi:hypothetical protein QAD02_021416 [Eretmocerus hayati]|uniref:Uncharacterized protein n=1 Tax=Eretmocerus hayati TaxID=131215 RepID=A0ACC2PR75_9HYME|nr:hypothetical protein QAD02_021416 [Eretmocerus hayati]